MLQAHLGSPIDHGGPVDRPFEAFPESALDGSVVDRFDAIVCRFPHRLAVQDAAFKLTYADVAAIAARIASATVTATAGRAGPVAILLRNEARFPAAMLGVLAAGRCYVPLDAAQPIARNQLIARQAGAAAIISVDELADEARTLFSKNVPVLDIERLGKSSPAGAAPRPIADDLTYIVYTSGSSGLPKGIYRSHRSFLHDIMQFTNTLHLTCEDRLSLVYSPSVVAATRDIFGALLNGGSVHILPPRDLQPIGLARELRGRGITVLHAVPTLFRHIAEALGPGERLDSMRVVYLGGDRVAWSDVDEFRRVCPPGAFLYVTLASTECATHTQWFVDESLRTKSPQLPVGRTVPDFTVMIVDDNGSTVADGEVGEVVAASRYMGMGYWNDSELTEKNFTVDPADSKSRIVQTGDLCRRRPDGLLEYVGRKDVQIKLHGHRIEPAEIEHALIQLPQIADAVAVVRNNDSGIAQALAAYVKLKPEGRGLLPRHLAAILEQRLPRHMIPWPIYVVDEFPRLPSSKIDRRRLMQMDAARHFDDRTRAEHSVADEVARVFERVLGVSGATADDSIASLGGDSLQVTEIAAELETHFGVVVADDIMAATRSIRDFAMWIAEQRLTRARA
jgi:amino acid adenylation domain-containing protein